MQYPAFARVLTYVLLLNLPLLLASCAEKQADTVGPNSIEGNWKISAIKLNPGLDVPPIGRVTDLLTAYALLRQTTCLTDVTITFRSDGTLVSSNPPSCQPNVAEIKQQTGIDLAGSSRWTLSGDQLVLTASDNTKLTATSTINGGVMVWSYKRPVTDLNGVSTNQDFTFEFRRG